MRIISDFYDYYDSVQKYGQDQSIVYNRKIKQIPELLKLREPYGVIGFCGKWYPFLHEQKEFELDKYIYDKKLITEKEKHYFFREDPVSKTEKLEIEPFIKYNTPIIVQFSYYNWRKGTNEGTEINARLNIFQFQKIKDPMTAFQEIQMFISGVLGTPEKETIQISDNDMRDKKGFDKWSFRRKVR